MTADEHLAVMRGHLESANTQDLSYSSVTTIVMIDLLRRVADGLERIVERGATRGVEG